MLKGGKVAGEGGHIEKMCTLCKLANDTGANIKDDWFITKLLDLFPESWDTVITPMYSETNLSNIIMNLMTYTKCLAIREAKSRQLEISPAINTVKALETTVLALQAEIKLFKSFHGPGGLTNPNKAHLKCSNYGKVGHIVDDCFQQGGGKAGQYPHWWKGKHTTTMKSVVFAMG